MAASWLLAQLVQVLLSVSTSVGVAESDGLLFGQGSHQWTT